MILVGLLTNQNAASLAHGWLARLAF